MRAARVVVLLALATAASCRGVTETGETGPRAGVRVINLLQGGDNAAIGFETGRPLTTINFPSVAPTEDAAYFFVAATIPRQLRVLLTTTTVLDSAFTFNENQFYTIVTTGAVGQVGARAPGYLILLNNQTAVARSSVRFRFIHGAGTVGPVDIHNVADSGSFDATTRLLASVAYRGVGSIESSAPGNRAMCVIVAGTVPTANGSNCIALRLYGVGGGAALTAALREPTVTESAPGVIFSLDRSP